MNTQGKTLWSRWQRCTEPVRAEPCTEQPWLKVSVFHTMLDCEESDEQDGELIFEHGAGTEPELNA